jgi:hypothetical protein
MYQKWGVWVGFTGRFPGRDGLVWFPMRARSRPRIWLGGGGWWSCESIDRSDHLGVQCRDSSKRYLPGRTFFQGVFHAPWMDRAELANRF